MQADHIGSHFSHNGPINFISRPDCYICKDASVDTHIDVTNVNDLITLKKRRLVTNFGDPLSPYNSSKTSPKLDMIQPI